MNYSLEHNWDEEFGHHDDPPDFDVHGDQGNQAAIEECKDMFRTKDFIMETNAAPTVEKFLNAGGVPNEFISMLAENYTGAAQAANLMADWLIVAGVDVVEVQSIVEDHLKTMIVKSFDPKKADSIFSDVGQSPLWIESMIAHHSWRTMIFELSEKYPDCLMLNFTVKLISDLGYQSEMSGLLTACNQIGVFTQLLKSTLLNLLSCAEGEMNAALVELTRAAMTSKHLYMFSQTLLQHLSEASNNSVIYLRVRQELEREAHERGHRIWEISLLLSGCGKYPAVYGSVLSLLNRNELSPGDIATLFKIYASSDPPPVDFIRIPQLLDLLVKSLFTPGSQVRAEYLQKYVYVLGYATSVYETWKKKRRVAVCKDELKGTVTALERVHQVCSREIGGLSQMSNEVNMLFQCIRFPVVAMGILAWVQESLSEKNYVKVITDATPIHVVLLDEVSTCHPLQHSLVLNILIRLFEASYSQLETLMELEFKKTILDRMVHLLSRGYVMPVVKYIRQCMDNQTADMSLIRHFVIEVLEMIAPPYSPEFIDAFLPVVKNNEITKTLRTAEGNDDVSVFIGNCESAS